MWEQTDMLQFVKKVDEDNFEVLETVVAGDERNTLYDVCHMIIDINDYDLEEEIRGYYSSLEEVKNIYGGEWKQIMAEIIAENNATKDNRFDSVEGLKEYFKDVYGIVIDYEAVF